MKRICPPLGGFKTAWSCELTTEAERGSRVSVRPAAVNLGGKTCESRGRKATADERASGTPASLWGHENPETHPSPKGVVSDAKMISWVVGHAPALIIGGTVETHASGACDGHHRLFYRRCDGEALV